jgi:hypothetical protein
MVSAISSSPFVAIGLLFPCLFPCSFPWVSACGFRLDVVPWWPDITSRTAFLDPRKPPLSGYSDAALLAISERVEQDN